MYRKLKGSYKEVKGKLKGHMSCDSHFRGGSNVPFTGGKSNVPFTGGKSNVPLTSKWSQTTIITSL